MSHIVLTEDQARILAESTGPVEMRDPQGRTLACVTPFDPVEREMLERARQSIAAGGKRIPSARVRMFLQRLHEMEKSEGIDEAKVKELLQRTIAEESK